MTPQELKNSILQLAIQGKLVEQRPEEGTAEELYRQIQKEKQKLIKEGKIKKEKPLPEITEDEVPFDIPESWKWVRLGELCTLIRGITFPGGEKSREPLKGCVRCATTGSVQSSYNEAADVFVPEKYIKNPMQWLEYEDIILSTANSKELVGKSCIWIGKDKMTFGGFLTVARFPDSLFRKYFYYVLQHLHKSGIFARASTQTTNIANINNDILSKMLITLPPLAEQKRIVAKIEELLPYIDRYEAAWSKLEELNKRFPVDMQKSILQYAIQGKLVEQRPEEGTGEELYQQIQKEKAKLIKEGKIKKEKPLPEITEDEIPFDIPESWKALRFGLVITLLSGTDFKPEEYNDCNKGTVYITGASCLSDEGVIESRWTETPRIIAEKGDVLLVCKGSGYGKTVICDVQQAHIARQIMAIKKTELLDMRYIKYFLMANISSIKKSGQGVIPGINRGSVLNMVFPLPPLAEQKHIVAKLEEILPLCEKLNSKGG